MASTLKNLNCGEVTFTIEELDNDILQLRKEKEKVRERERNKELATSLHDVFQSYIDAGFTEEHAWEVITITLKK